MKKRIRSNQVKKLVLRKLILFCLGLLLVIVGLSYIFYRRSVLSFNSSTLLSPVSETTNFPPVRIVIAAAGIDQTIVETNIKNGVWAIPQMEAAHLASSASPGDRGNIVIYGHNKLSIFGKLKEVNQGDYIGIINSGGRILNYRVQEKVVVDPKQIKYVLPTETETLTVYTCTGVFDSKRLIVSALPVERI